jgi:L-serine dehydratase
MENEAGQVMTVRGESLGGGKVRIVGINGVAVDFSGEYNALIVVQRGGTYHQDPQ